MAQVQSHVTWTLSLTASEFLLLMKGLDITADHSGPLDPGTREGAADLLARLADQRTKLLVRAAARDLRHRKGQDPDFKLPTDLSRDPVIQEIKKLSLTIELEGDA